MFFKSGTKIGLNTHLGILTDAEWQIFRDKFYTYELFKSSGLLVDTFAYIDPLAIDHYAQFVVHQDLEEIVADIKTKLNLPLIVKRNSGTQGQNVFLCRDLAAVKKALAKIYSKRQLEYDHVALAQEYVLPKCEYRLVVFGGNLEFAYVKPHHRPEFGGVVEPKIVNDLELLKKMKDLVDRLNKIYPLIYAGIDVVETESGELRVIEVNGSPTYSSFIKLNGRQKVVELFRKIVEYLDKR